MLKDFIATSKVLWFIRNNSARQTVNLKLEGKKLMILGACVAFASVAWFYIPSLSVILIYFLVPLAFYFVYSTYNFLKNAYSKHNDRNNDKNIDSYCPEFVMESLETCAFANPQRALKLIICIKSTKQVLESLEQSMKDGFYNLLLLSDNIDNMYKLVIIFKEISELLGTVRQSTRGKFFNYLSTSACITSGSYNSQEALNLTYAVKEIDATISSIVNENLRNHADEFFTVANINIAENRHKMLEFARACKKIDIEIPQEVLNEKFASMKDQLHSDNTLLRSNSHKVEDQNCANTDFFPCVAPLNFCEAVQHFYSTKSAAK
ncbi:MAG: hypothetical protein QWI36_00490 [Wolbachia endosymbiont of Tyrophagus putrescentiae]|nr:hypothetical protein [Wolbachia endosymbiont of Tyrophagus putrescentiae]